MEVRLWRSLLVDGLAVRCCVLSYLTDTLLTCGAVGNGVLATIRMVFSIFHCFTIHTTMPQIQ